MKIDTCAGTVVDIRTLREDAEGYFKVRTTNDLEKLVKAMGWTSLAAFTADFNVTASELVGKWWLVYGPHPQRLDIR